MLEEEALEVETQIVELYTLSRRVLAFVGYHNEPQTVEKLVGVYCKIRDAIQVLADSDNQQADDEYKAMARMEYWERVTDIDEAIEELHQAGMNFTIH